MLLNKSTCGSPLNKDITQILAARLCFFLIFLILSFAGQESLLYADTVTLKSGIEHDNVRTKIRKDIVILQFQNNKIEEFTKSAIRYIKIKPVIILAPKNAEEKALNEKEKIRVAESLSESDFEVDEDKKLNLAILNFKMGNGIEKEELDLISEMITSGIVKTKLFKVMGKGEVNKALNEKGGTGCADDSEKCSLSQNSILQSLNASKVLTGNILKVKNKYYINGTVLDVKTNKIDFVEVSIVDSFEKFQETSEYFSKKVAGGMLLYSNESFELTTEKSNSFNMSKIGFPFTNFFGKPVVQSAFVPGLGQWNKNDKIKAGFIFSSSLLLIGVIVAKHAEYNSLHSDSEATRTLIGLNFINPIPYLGFYIDSRRSDIYSEMRNVNNEIQIASGILATIYVYNLLDAYFAKEKVPPKEPLKTGFQFQMNSNSLSTLNGGIKRESFIEASYRWNF